MVEQTNVRLDEMWREFGPSALRYATVLVGPHDAHDVMANAFLQVWRTAGLDGVLNLRSYLMRAVTNQAHDLRRQRARRWRRDLAAVPMGHVDLAEPAIDLRRSVAALSVAQRAVIFLTYWEDLSELAIAELLGLSTGTVHRNLERAREQLRKDLR